MLLVSAVAVARKYSESNGTANDALVVQAGLSNVSIAHEERPILRC
jgi:stage V sporulation protein SpoVS